MTPERKIQAMQIQDACNPHAVARFLVRVLDEMKAEDSGASWNLASDPAAVMIVCKLADMAGIEYQIPAPAFDACYEAQEQDTAAVRG